jgi:hypothetical protein
MWVDEESWYKIWRKFRHWDPQKFQIVIHDRYLSNLLPPISKFPLTNFLATNIFIESALGPTSPYFLRVLSQTVSGFSWLVSSGLNVDCVVLLSLFDNPDLERPLEWADLGESSEFFCWEIFFILEKIYTEKIYISEWLSISSCIIVSSVNASSCTN